MAEGTRLQIYAKLLELSWRLVAATVKGDVDTINAIEIHVNRLHKQLSALKDKGSHG
jgi:hypothetical protein